MTLELTSKDKSDAQTYDKSKAVAYDKSEVQAYEKRHGEGWAPPRVIALDTPSQGFFGASKLMLTYGTRNRPDQTHVSVLYHILSPQKANRE